MFGTERFLARDFMKCGWDRYAPDASARDAGASVAATRYNGTIHDFVLLNALSHVPSTEAALRQASGGIRDHLSK